jgi:hypothetical protein
VPSPRGFTLEEDQQTRYFPDIDSVFKYYAAYLKHPFRSRLNTYRWFYGETSTAEATAMLSNHSPGTFLVRFSSLKGSYAVSYVADDGSVVHALAAVSPAGRYYFNNHSEMFESIPDLVTSYAQLLRTPFEVTVNVDALRQNSSGLHATASSALDRS